MVSRVLAISCSDAVGPRTPSTPRGEPIFVGRTDEPINPMHPRRIGDDTVKQAGRKRCSLPSASNSEFQC